MKFLYPQFLYALGLLSIPILIHLFNFKRYKTVYFSSIRFLKEVQEETRSTSRLKHLLVLMSRLLALSFLVFAFAQPFIPAQDNAAGGETSVISIYLDNSFSMDALSQDKPLIEKARDISSEIVRSSGESARFLLTTNDFERRHQRLLSADEMLSFLDEVESSPKVVQLSEVWTRQSNDPQLEPGKSRFYQISDFQEGITDLKLDSNANIALVPIQSVQSRNLYIDSVWFFEPIQIIRQQNMMVIRLINDGDEDLENSRLSLKVNGKIKSVADVNIPANATFLDTISLSLTEPGWNRAEVQVNDYPVSFDDNYYLTFNVLNSIPVMVIGNEAPNPFLTAFYNQNEVFSALFTNLSSLDLSQINQQNLIILSGMNRISSGLANELSSFVRKGGSLMVFPSKEIELNSYNELFGLMNVDRFKAPIKQKRSIRKINVEENVFRDVFEDLPDNIRLPSTEFYYPFDLQTTVNRENILELADGNDFINKYSVESGKLYICSSPLDKELTDLPLHAIFAPMIYKMGILSTGKISHPFTLQNQLNVQLEGIFNTANGALRIKGESVEFIPEQRSVAGNIVLNLGEQIKQDGIYNVLNGNDEVMASIAVNYDRKESNLKCFSKEDLEEKYGDQAVSVIDRVDNISQAVAELDRGKSLWKLCIILSLVFLGIEILLLRLLPG